MKKTFLFLSALCLGGFLRAQDITDNSVLMIVGQDTVTRGGFCKAYLQNSMKGEALDREKMEEYLQLYADFRMKVEAAKDAGYDTVALLQKEFTYYKEQLEKPYLMDTNVRNAIYEELYGFMQHELRIRYVMLHLPYYYMAPEDTLAAYEKLMDVRRQLLDGADFADMVIQYCDEYKLRTRNQPRPKLGFEGEIGYVTAFDLDYNLEKAIHNLEVGEISMPVRNQYGYYLIQLMDKKPAMGMISASHILKVPVFNDSVAFSPEQLEEEIMRVYDTLQAGMNFEDAAYEFSDDTYSSRNGGSLGKAFASSQMIPEFVAELYNLAPGQYSKPFKSRYGWHIARLNSKSGVGTYEENRSRIMAEVERSPMLSRKPFHAFQDKLLQEHEWKMDQKVLAELRRSLPDTVRKSTLPQDSMENPVLFAKTVMVYDGKPEAAWGLMDLARNLLNRQDFVFATDQWFDEMVKEFQRAVALRRENAHLEQKYPEFKALLEEYRDGLYLFDISNKNVWAKAVMDSSGLETYYEAHKNEYMKPGKAVAMVFVFDEGLKAAKVGKMVATADKEGWTEQEAKAAFNKKFGDWNVLVDSAVYGHGENAFVDKVEWKTGLSEVVENDEGRRAFVLFKEIIPEAPAPLDEVRGLVVSDYQGYLEKEWVKELRSRYPVRIFQDVFESIFQK